ncbi:hypothetical protein [Chromobacterium haemolyticum]|uniref:hypothetical protein n=1 Tax=Chromobacterium haemolyticum TaxID=394935 RepID=UPI00244CA6EA|nr:hypothetical protein [Chromobacterium haemolyticum]MDH0342115.1 hypothetical protein [Chromobacterium haemolyticum]
MNTYRYLLHSRSGKYFQQDEMVHAGSKEAADLAVFNAHHEKFVIGDCRHIEANTDGKYLTGIFA